jgi:DNA-binding transcriptional LysR family regulator
MSGEVLIRQLEYLAALAREHHFGRAASKCFVSQPALSAGIRKLERELDVTIVQRGRQFRGFTPEGQLVVGWAHRILAERDGLRADLDQMRNGLSSTLRIGTIPTAVPITTFVSERFTLRHPRARVQVEELSSREISLRLKEFRLDVGISYLDDGTSSSTDSLVLYRERYFIVLPSQSPLAEHRVVSWPDAASLPLCLLTPAMRNRRIIDAIFAASGKVVMPVVETDNMGSLYAHVASRRLATIASQAWLYAFGAPTGMCIRPLIDSRPPVPIGLVRMAAEPISIAADAAWNAVEGLDIEAELDRVVVPLLPHGGSGQPPNDER